MSAEGRSRLVWADLPDGVAHLVQEQLGSEVVASVSHDGGYSPGLASTLVTGSGERVFVKAVGESMNTFAVELYRREAAVAPLLDERVPAPAFRWSAEESIGGDDWVALAFDAADGPGPGDPWTADGIAAAVDLADRIGDLDAPAGLPAFADEQFRHWHEVAADPELSAGIAALDPWAGEQVDRLVGLADGWADAVAGTALVHGDLRADNMVTLAGTAAAVDWPSAVSGAPWVDLVCLLPSMVLEGAGEAEELLAMSRHAAAADAEAVNVVLAAIAGYFLHSSLQPPPPGIPHVRRFQRDQGLVCTRWLGNRLDGTRTLEP
ncbi:phosphotransferase family protein [Ruania zhangjianzhongii]|uniref:phosphotransferase family protein n=1 Tax=Ruania zhangjianzhongii TaxID=2603206 RepID=UPI00143D19CA|nr:phosphotransferase [Ruania zhangjianzhongii]